MKENNNKKGTETNDEFNTVDSGALTTGVNTASVAF